MLCDFNARNWRVINHNFATFVKSSYLKYSSTFLSSSLKFSKEIVSQHALPQQTAFPSTLDENLFPIPKKIWQKSRSEIFIFIKNQFSCKIFCFHRKIKKKNCLFKHWPSFFMFCPLWWAAHVKFLLIIHHIYINNHRNGKINECISLWVITWLIYQETKKTTRRKIDQILTIEY